MNILVRMDRNIHLGHSVGIRDIMHILTVILHIQAAQEEMHRMFQFNKERLT